MSECVVRMEMPKNNCEMAVEIKGVGDWCPIMAEVCDYYLTKKMPDWCPIISELPEGHGRLVDADELSKYWKCRIALMNSCSGKRGILESVEASTLKSCIEDIGSAKTIVPAEAERSEK